MKTSCGIRLMHKDDVMVEKQRETQEVAGRIKWIPQACGDLPRRFREDFWKLEHCPDAVRLVASAGLITITPHSRAFRTPPPVFFQWRHYRWATSRKAESSTPADAITPNLLHSPPPLPPPLLGLHSLTPSGFLQDFSPRATTHTHTPLTAPPRTIPCRYLDVLSIREWKWGRAQIQPLSHKISCPRGSFLPGWIDVASRLPRWWRGRRALRNPERAVSAARRACLPAAARAAFRRCYGRLVLLLLPGIPRLPPLASDCFHSALEGSWVKVYHRLSQQRISPIFQPMRWGLSLPPEATMRVGQSP